MASSPGQQPPLEGGPWRDLVLTVPSALCPRCFPVAEADRGNRGGPDPEDDRPGEGEGKGVTLRGEGEGGDSSDKSLRDGLACIYLHAFLNRALALIAVLCNYRPFAQLFTRYIFLEAGPLPG